MRDDDFAVWLEKTGLTTRAQSDAKSRCRRIEQSEDDLDKHFVKDSMESLLDRLKYSRADESDGVLVKHNIPINGDMVNGTASLLSAAKKYQKFCLDYPPKQ
ncbi:MAG: hypothetical protein ACXWT3_06130 [Methylococcaceae bacterium]